MSRGRLEIGAALVLTAPFVPMLFQGEEWGASSPFQYFTAHEDAKLARRVRDGRRHELARFDWDTRDLPDPQAESTFTRSKLDWTELGRQPHAALLAWYRALIALRRRTPALHDGRRELVRARYDEDAAWLIVERGLMVIACNLAGRPQRLPLDTAGRQLILGSRSSAQLGAGWIDLPAESVAIVCVQG
jgi:maltooligosyltrehalose trehalohydrolase